MKNLIILSILTPEQSELLPQFIAFGLMFGAAVGIASLFIFMSKKQSKLDKDV